MYIQKANSQAQYLTCQYCLHGFYPQTMQTQMEVNEETIKEYYSLLFVYRKNLVDGNLNPMAD